MISEDKLQNPEVFNEILKSAKKIFDGLEIGESDRLYPFFKEGKLALNYMEEHGYSYKEFHVMNGFILMLQDEIWIKE